MYSLGNDKTTDIISVIQFGIKNNGTVIGLELNDLVKRAHGKTLYFPAGVYNLSEPIILPYDYSKNVNIIFDKNAFIKSDIHLEALLKVGYYEMSTPDRTHRRFSYIEGGMFDCSNVDNGIMVNGLKQLVSLSSISLFKGSKTHIRIHVTDDFKGTGSADTKIDNVTIQGLSSNQEVYGIYIDESCADIKISNTFIYGTKYGITTRSGGHIFNNIHILSQVTTGGLNKGPENFLSTEGIRVEDNGFFILHEVYFDTIDESIVISRDHTPTLMIDKNIYYSYLPHFGTSFISKDHLSEKSFQAKITNSVFHIQKSGYKIFDINPLLVGYDVSDYYTFVNSHLINTHLLSPYDPSLLQKMRKKTNDALVLPNLNSFDTDWYVIGALISSPFRNSLRIDLSETHAIEVEIKFSGDTLDLIRSHIIDPDNNLPFHLGYTIVDAYCVLALKPKREAAFYPVVTDLLGNGSFMITPSKDKHYRLNDYNISEEPTVLIEK